MIDSSTSASQQYQYPSQSAYNPYDDHHQQIQQTCEFTPFKPTSCIDIKPRTFRDHRLEAYRDACETAAGFEDDEMFCPYELLQVSHLVLSGKLPDSKAPYHNPKKPFKGNLTSLISNSQLLSEQLKNYPLYYTVTKSPPHRTRKIYQVSNDTNTRPTPPQFHNFREQPVHPLPNFTDSGVPPHPNYFVPRGVPIQPMSVQPPPHYSNFSHYPPLQAYYSQQGQHPEPNNNGESRKHKKSSWYIPRKNSNASNNPPSSDRTPNNWTDWDQSGTSQSSTQLGGPILINPSAGTYGGAESFQPGFECDPIYHPTYVSHPAQPSSQLSATTQAFHPGTGTLLEYLKNGNSEIPSQEHQKYPLQQRQQQQQEEEPHAALNSSHQTPDQTPSVSLSSQEQKRCLTEEGPPSLSNHNGTIFSGRSTQKPPSRRFSQKPRSSRGRTTSLPDGRDHAHPCVADNGRSERDGYNWRRHGVRNS